MLVLVLRRRCFMLPSFYAPLTRNSLETLPPNHRHTPLFLQFSSFLLSGDAPQPFSSTPTLQCIKRCTLPNTPALIANSVNGTCTTGTLVYSTNCSVACASGSDPVSGSTFTYVCKPTGTDFQTTPSLVCKKRMSPSFSLSLRVCACWCVSAWCACRRGCKQRRWSANLERSRAQPPFPATTTLPHIRTRTRMYAYSRVSAPLQTTLTHTRPLVHTQSARSRAATAPTSSPPAAPL